MEVGKGGKTSEIVVAPDGTVVERRAIARDHAVR